MKQLNKTERQEISILLSKNYSLRSIAKALGRNTSTISREIKRNSVKNQYNPNKAHTKSHQRRYWITKPPPKLWKEEWKTFNEMIEEKLNQKYPWSIEQIVGYWNKKNPHQTVSVPTIYKYLYKWRSKLCKYLPTKRQRRRKRSFLSSKRQMIPNRTWIDNRPKEINTRLKIGHWEGDTLGSKKGETETILGTIERKSRFLLARKIPNRKPKQIAKHFQEWQKKYNVESITLDSGIEFKQHQTYNCKTYFCHPYSSWEKGQIEYAMRLLRKLVPKKSSMKKVSESQLQ